MTKNHPIQPLQEDARGVLRFRENKLVRALLDHGTKTGLGLNELARLADIPPEDRMQLAQLIGYSLSGYGELGYVTDEAYVAACATQEMPEAEARAFAVSQKLGELRTAINELRPVAAALFEMHPDDLAQGGAHG